MSQSIASTVVHGRNRNPGAVDPHIYGDGILTLDNLWGWWPLYKQTGYSDNDLMGTLLDCSGNNRNGSSAGAARPTYKTNIANGLPVARFAGNHYFDIGATYTFNQATWFLVWSRVNAANSDAVLLVDGNNYSYLQYGTSWYWANGGATTVAMAASSFKLKCAKYDNSNVTLYTNGVQDASPSSSADCAWRYIGSGGFQIYGDYAEILLFNTNLSDTDRNYVESRINAKYALW